jgi:uncharacterized membrane protein
LRAGATVRNLIQTGKSRSEAYCVGAALVVVVFFALAAFVFAAFVFFAFVVFVVSCVPAASCANTGIASEKATANVKSSVRSFFMVGPDLLMMYFVSCYKQGVDHFS